MTFSSTVMSPMTWTIWKVRAMPRRQTRSALKPVMSRPRQVTVPALGLWKPVMQPKSVLFPAPLGPMMLTISPSSTCLLYTSPSPRDS